MSNKIITHKFRELLLPTILIAMALNITIIVNASFVATYIGHNGQAALQVLEPLILLISIIEWLFGLGGQILSLGKKAEFDEDGSNHYFTVAMITTILISFLIFAVCILFEDTIIMILHPTVNTLPYVKSYGFYLYMSFPIATIISVLCQFIRVDGQPNFASAIIIIANIINIILDFLFLGVFHMGIEGASLAMLIGYSVAALCALKYYFDSKRTFKFTLSKLKIKTLIMSTIEIIKIGFPGAGIGLFDVILVYVMNLILGGLLGELGLNLYNVCLNALLIICILILGFAETLSSIVPVYYYQDDFFNIKYIVKRSIMITVICSLVFTAFLLIYPDGILILYKLDVMPNDAMVETAIRLYSLSFIPTAISIPLIFYYEGIERTVESIIISAISSLIGPLVFTCILYHIIGLNGIWISFTLGVIMSIVIVAIYVKIVQRKEREYSGLLFIKKYLIKKTKNYTLKNKNDDIKDEIINHLKSLNVRDSYLETLNRIIDTIFDSNSNSIHIEILIIDYGNKITINLKDEGKIEAMKNIKKSFSNENIKVSEVLGFNNIEYIINKS